MTVRLWLIGIGTGSPGHLTREAIEALAGVDLVLIPRKGAAKDDLATLRRRLCAEHRAPDALEVAFDMPVRDAVPGYLAGVERWHDAIARCWHALFTEHLPDGGSAALLVWGDPSLYDSSLRIARRPPLDATVRITVVPGPTSLQALAAAHAIPLHGVGEPFLVTTGRRLRDDGWPDGVPNVAVMLDGDNAFLQLDPAGVEIWWGAYLGMGAQQLLLSGALEPTAPRIVATRREARRRHGWIMDTYLLRREPRPASAPASAAGTIAGHRSGRA